MTMKKLLMCAGGVILLGLGTCVSGAVWLECRSEAESKAHEEEQAAVSISATFDDQCPVTVTVHNGTKRTLKSLPFDLMTFMPGNSAPFSKVEHQWTRVVRPGATETQCYSFKGDRARANPQLIVRAQRTWTAEFYNDGDFIP